MFNKTIMSSDVGSLLYLSNLDPNEKDYKINICTPSFASKEHYNDIVEEIPRCKSDLFNEDKH
jgi:hypothetical protein